MPALHVLGEILGASGLTHDDALSVSRVLDLLSLNPSSSRSFFCRWRLQLEGVDDLRSTDGAAAWSKTWEILHGDGYGQTQVHCPTASASIPIARAMDPNHTTEQVLLDVVWAHPIDLHVASPPAFSRWPHLELQVWSLDRLNQPQLCGAASVCIPSASGEYFLDVPLARAVPSSWIDRVAESLAIPTSDDAKLLYHPVGEEWEAQGGAGERKHAGGVDEWPLVEPGGTVFVRLAVLQRSS